MNLSVKLNGFNIKVSVNFTYMLTGKFIVTDNFIFTDNFINLVTKDFIFTNNFINFKVACKQFICHHLGNPFQYCDTSQIIFNGVVCHNKRGGGGGLRQQSIIIMNPSRVRNKRKFYKPHWGVCILLECCLGKKIYSWL